MIRYIPFLKLKENEIKCVKHLSSALLDQTIVFWELPASSKGYTEATLKNGIDKVVKKLHKNKIIEHTCFIDNYEIPDNITIGGNDSYQYFLDTIGESHNIIPVAGINRTNIHNEIALNYANRNSRRIAIRLTADDIVSLSIVKDEIDQMFESLSEDVLTYLIIDLKVISETDLNDLNLTIVKFIREYQSAYGNTHFIITGSSIPSNITALAKLGKHTVISRKETKLFEYIQTQVENTRVILGDYATVSPEYADDIPGEILYNVMSAKLIYSDINTHHIIRGKSIKKEGYKQYQALIRSLISNSVYRGEKYSYGDRFFHERQFHGEKNCTPSTIICPSLNAHITYMLRAVDSTFYTC